MIYLDNAATTLEKPDCVIQAMTHALKELGNPARGAYQAAMDASRLVLEARCRLADFFDVGDSARVVFTPNVTASLNLVISSIRGHIVTTAAEHNSVLRPIYHRGEDYTVVPCRSNGTYSLQDVAQAIRPDTAALVVTHASNLTGNVYDIAALGELCAQKGILFVVDAAQTAGLLPISTQKLHISALCFTGHKSLMGPQGIGGLCLAPEFLPDSFCVGGSGFHSFSKEHPDALPERLEAGTLNVPGIAGLLAGVEYLEAEGMDALYHSVMELEQRFVDDARRIPGVTLYGAWNIPQRVPVVALNIQGISADEAAYRLDREYGIAVRPGAHCAPLMHEALGTASAGAVRFSFSHRNTPAEIDTALEALETLAR